MTNLPKVNSLELELCDGWLTIALNRPEARNALSGQMTDEIKAVLGSVRDDRSVRGITFRGNGGVFCAGGDLKGFRAIFEKGQDGYDEAKALSIGAGDFFQMINAAPQLTVAVVEGAAMAGGFGMACACDVVIAEENAKFALSETMIGITPAQIAPYIIQRTGIAVGRHLMLTGAQMTAVDAASKGIVDLVASDREQLEQHLGDIKQQTLRCAPGAVAITKEVVAALDGRSKEDFIEFAADAFAGAIVGDEGREGISSFLEKRAPAWRK